MTPYARPALVEFDVESLVGEIFKLLRLLKPIIAFFSREDGRGLVQLMGWTVPVRTAAWMAVVFTLTKSAPGLVWPAIQVHPSRPPLWCVRP
jgi:hypothetical protein